MSSNSPNGNDPSALILPRVGTEGKPATFDRVFGGEQLSNWRHCSVAMLSFGVVAGMFWWSSHGAGGPGPQPIWEGHKLQDWIEARDANMRYDESQDTHSPFTDCEIYDALAGLGPAAIPFLRHWLISRPRRFTPWLNDLLSRQSWIQMRFRADYTDHFLARSGFQAYQDLARPLLPELVVLVHGRDVELRDRAYEAAFLTFPAKEVFLALAHDGLKESDPSTQAMSAWWIKRRYPEEAEKAGLRRLFPDLYKASESLIELND